jgi:hypothetical protein
MAYKDFDLKLSGERQQGFFVEVLQSPQFLRSNPVRLLLPEAEIAVWKSTIRVGLGTRTQTLTLGRHLFEALFPREILRIWESSMIEVDRRNPLRLRLDIRSAELTVVPWEIIHDGRGYLAMTGLTPLVRCSHDWRQVGPIEKTLPLNILMVVSQPSDAQALPNIERESRLIEAGISNLVKDRKVGRVDVIRKATRQRVQDQLAKNDYHVLHYMGHGIFENDKGYLIFEDENGRSERVDGETASYFFGGAPLRLLFLNSCETAVASQAESFLGTAQAALAAGVPAVVAMQDSIVDGVAAKFAQEFYQTLAAERTLEFCMAEARKAINSEQGADWAIPVLFSNASEGLLWQPERVKQDEILNAPEAGLRPDFFIYQEGEGNIVAENVNQQTTYNLVESSKKRR